MRLTLLTALLLAAAVARAEQFTVATYNIENFREHFQAATLTTQPAITQALGDAEILRRLQKEDDEDNWEAGQVILDPKLNPDVLVIQEGCNQEQLEKFNKRWLNGAYATLMIFPGNSERGQTVGMLLKPGFKVIERRDQYYLEADSVANPRGDRLFARGPAFCLIETPGGYRLWIGTNHQKSKSGNSVEVTKWRNREAARTNQIINNLSKDGPADVMFLGDMNDELHYQEFEQEAGGDAIATIVGEGDQKLFLATEKLAESGAISYGGYWDSRHRTFIDHIFTTQGMKQKIDDPQVFNEGLAKVASDHYPVSVHVHVP